MNRIRPVLNQLLVLTTVLVLSACTTLVKRDAVEDNLPRVLDRHDAYAPEVMTDPTEALSESSTVRAVWTADSGGYLPKSVYPVILRVLDRHDTWVQADESLSPIVRDVYLDSSQALRFVFTENE